MNASSHKYGKPSGNNLSPNLARQNPFETTNRISFKTPTVQPKAVWRTRDHTIQFENSAKLQLKNFCSSKLATGYGSNRQEWDSTYWKTEKNLHTDQTRTIYRVSYNSPKPFHKARLTVTDGILKRREQVWDLYDK